MQMYVVSPTRTAEVTPEHPLFRFDVSTLVCASHPIKLIVLGESRYTSLVQIDVTDAELDDLIEKALAARATRRGQKAATLAMLAAAEYDEGAISMETAERLQYLSGSVLQDTRDPDGDDTDFAQLAEQDAPDEDN